MRLIGMKMSNSLPSPVTTTGSFQPETVVMTDECPVPCPFSRAIRIIGWSAGSWPLLLACIGIPVSVLVQCGPWRF